MAEGLRKQFHRAGIWELLEMIDIFRKVYRRSFQLVKLSQLCSHLGDRSQLNLNFK